MTTTKTVTCDRCGVEQDPENPICVHLSTRKAGRASKLARAHGAEHYAWMGRRSAAKRWGIKYSPEAIAPTPKKATKGSK